MIVTTDSDETAKPRWKMDGTYVAKDDDSERRREKRALIELKVEYKKLNTFF